MQDQWEKWEIPLETKWEKKQVEAERTDLSAIIIITFTADLTQRQH